MKERESEMKRERQESDDEQAGPDGKGRVDEAT